jgi:CheY-like chemotaxis protein
VDDSSTCRKMTAKVLHKFAVQSDEACDGVEAVEKIITSLQRGCPNRFDGIILDSQMPNLDGKQAALKIRECGFIGRIYGCTGNANKEEVELFIANGADKVYMKPLDDKNFKSILKGKYRIHI